MGTTRETHQGVVTDNNDPEKRFRLKIASATLMGTDDNGEPVEFGDWVEPTFPVLFGTDGKVASAGFFAVPSVGVTVEIEVAVGSSFDESPGQTFISGSDPKWRASLFQLGDEIPEEFETNYPNRFGFKSASGHLFIFDDSEEGGKVMLAGRANDDGQSSFVSIEDDGSIQIITNAGQMLFFNADKGELTLLDASQNMIAMKPDGITVVSGNGHTLDLNDAGVNILAAGPVFVQGDNVTLKVNPTPGSGKILLGDETAAVPVLIGSPPGAPSTLLFVTR